MPAHPTGIGVVVLHGFLETVAIPVTQGWSASSDRHGFVAIYPGRGYSWNAGLCCDSASAAKRDDVSWLVTAIDTARSRYGLKTIYLAGNSNGGMMVERLLAERPTVSNRFAVWAAAPEMPSRRVLVGVRRPLRRNRRSGDLQKRGTGRDRRGACRDTSGGKHGPLAEGGSI